MLRLCLLRCVVVVVVCVGTVGLLRVGLLLSVFSIPPPLSAELPPMVQLTMVGDESLQYTPPPPLPMAKFPQIVQLVMIGEEFCRQLTPLSPTLPEMMQLVMVGEENKHCTPLWKFAIITQFSRRGEEPTQETPL